MKTVLAITAALLFTACATPQTGGQRKTASAGDWEQTTTQAVIGSATEVNAVKKGDVSFTFDSCNENSIHFGNNGSAFCNVKFKNVTLFLKDPDKYGMSYGVGPSFSVENDRFGISFQNIKPGEVSAQVQMVIDVLKHNEGDGSVYSIKGNKMILKNVTMIVY